MIFEDGLDIKNHVNEMETAYWLLNTFGGKITVLKEKNIYKMKTPDYEWNERLWELKSAKGKSSIMEATRLAFKQTKEKQGGMILDIKNTKYDINSVLSIIKHEINIIHKANGLIIIKNKNVLIAIMKIIKRS